MVLRRVTVSDRAGPARPTDMNQNPQVTGHMHSLTGGISLPHIHLGFSFAVQNMKQQFLFIIHNSFANLVFPWLFFFFHIIPPTAVVHPTSQIHAEVKAGNS